MAYNATYAASDVAPVVVDNIVGIGAAIFSFVTLVALILLYGWMKKRI